MIHKKIFFLLLVFASLLAQSQTAPKNAENDLMGKQLVSLIKNCIVEAVTEKDYPIDDFGFDESRRTNTLLYDAGNIKYASKTDFVNTQKKSVAGTNTSATDMLPSEIKVVSFGEDGPFGSKAEGSGFYISLKGLRHRVTTNAFDSDEDEDSEEQGVCYIAIRRECAAELKGKIKQLLKDKIPVE